MRKLILSALIVGSFISCNDENTVNEQVELSAAASRSCYSMERLEEQLASDPALALRMQEIEEFTQRALKNPEQFRVLSDGTLEVPVHVNVLYRTSAENISNAQIQSQIDVLNEDFGAYNSDYSQIPSIFQGVASGDIKIRFVWTTNDDMKKSSRGGINPTNCSTTLNMWVCNLGSSLLGYAQFPGGNCATDGVVMNYTAFGRIGTAQAPFGLGRTATHEVGHYFNLRHIWGDATCGNDFVADTPLHNTSNGGCPTFPHYSTCSGAPVEMTMNYMDYTYDSCMYMFTAGQAARMQATYAVGGPRASLR